MAIRPKMIKLAAQVADGLSMSVAASRTYLRETVELVEQELAAAGRDRSSFRITALAFGLIAPGIDQILGGMGPMLATFPPEPMEVLGKGALDGRGLRRERTPAGRTLEASKMLTADVVRELTFAAEPDGVGDGHSRSSRRPGSTSSASCRWVPPRCCSSTRQAARRRAAG